MQTISHGMVTKFKAKSYYDKHIVKHEMEVKISKEQKAQLEAFVKQ